MTLGLRTRFDLWEVAVMCGFTAVVVVSVAARPGRVAQHDVNDRMRSAERERLERRFGPNKASQFYEEWIIRDFFDDRRSGVFVDVGASHHQTFSNTWYLETALGWSGIAVDALPEFAEGYRLHRPRTRFFSFFVSDRSDERAALFVSRDNTLVSSSKREFTSQWASDAAEIQVATITLDDLLSAQGIQRIDFLSMDIELAEPKALAGFDIGRYRPQLVCVEGHADVRQEILTYFAAHGYVLLGQYLRVDVQNLWFTPLKGG